jgi:hypothetical protein
MSKPLREFCLLASHVDRDARSETALDLETNRVPLERRLQPRHKPSITARTICNMQQLWHYHSHAA